MSDFLNLWEKIYHKDIASESLWSSTSHFREEKFLPACFVEDLAQCYRDKGKGRLWSQFADLESGLEYRCWDDAAEVSWQRYASVGVVLAHPTIPRGIVGSLSIRPYREEERAKAGKVLYGGKIIQRWDISQEKENIPEHAVSLVENFLAPYLREGFAGWQKNWRQGWIIDVSDSLGRFLEGGIYGGSWDFAIVALLLAYLFRQRISSDIVMSGEWLEDGKAQSVDRIEGKYHGIHREKEKTKSRYKQLWLARENAMSFQEKNSIEMVPVADMEDFCERLIPGWQENLRLLSLPSWGKCFEIAQKIEQQYAEVYDSVVNKPLESVYAPMVLIAEAESEDQGKIRVILGPSGMGKSSHCKHSAWNQSRKYLQEPDKQRLPIMLSLRGVSGMGSLLSCVQENITEDVFLKTWHGLPSLCSCLAIWCDGLDESEDPVRIFSQLRLLCEAGARIEVTCRDYFFASLVQLGKIWERSYVSYRLQCPVDFAGSYFRQWNAEVPDMARMLEARPIFFAILASGFLHSPLPKNLSSLYCAFVSGLIAQRQKSHDFLCADTFLEKVSRDLETHWQVLEAMAFYLWERGETLWFTQYWSDLKDKAWLENFPLVFLYKNKISAEKFQDFFLFQSLFHGNASCLHFSHESFREYLTACSFSRYWSRNSDLLPIMDRIVPYEVIEFMHGSPSLPWKKIEQAARKNSLEQYDFIRLWKIWMGGTLSNTLPAMGMLLLLISFSAKVIASQFSWESFRWLPYFVSHFEAVSLYKSLLFMKSAVGSSDVYFFFGILSSFVLYLPFWLWRYREWKHLSALKLNSLHFLLLASSSERDRRQTRVPEEILKGILECPPEEKKLQEGMDVSLRIIQEFSLSSPKDQKSQKRFCIRDILAGLRNKNAWRSLLPKIASHRGNGAALTAPIENTPALRLDLKGLCFSPGTEEKPGSGNLDGLCLRKCDLDEWQAPGISLCHASLEQCSMTKACLREARFCQADLRWCDFQDADLQKADFTGADLRGVRFLRTNLEGAIFTQAQLRGATFEDALLSQADFRESKNFQKAKFFPNREAEKAFFPEKIFPRNHARKQYAQEACKVFLWMGLALLLWALGMPESFLQQESYLLTCLVFGILAGILHQKEYPCFSKRLLFLSLGLSTLSLFYCERFPHEHLRFASHGTELWGLVPACWGTMIFRQEENVRERLRYFAHFISLFLLVYTALALLRIGEEYAGALPGILWIYIPLVRSLDSVSWLAVVFQIVLVFAAVCLQRIFWSFLLYLCHQHKKKWLQRVCDILAVFLLARILWSSLHS